MARQRSLLADAAFLSGAKRRSEQDDQRQRAEATVRPYVTCHCVRKSTVTVAPAVTTASPMAITRSSCPCATTVTPPAGISPTAYLPAASVWPDAENFESTALLTTIGAPETGVPSAASTVPRTPPVPGACCASADTPSSTTSVHTFTIIVPPRAPTARLLVVRIRDHVGGISVHVEPDAARRPEIEVERNRGVDDIALPMRVRVG